MTKYELLEIEGKTIQISNPEKVLWPISGYTKRDLVNYYLKIAPYILPYIKDRPLTLNRFPEGINSAGFYQKDTNRLFPNWIKRYKHKGVEYLICNEAASLVYLAQLTCVEINPWLSVIETKENPDYVVVDLDPIEIEFNNVIETAICVHEMLNKVKIYNFCKTTGKRGLHIYIPIEPIYTYFQTKTFAEIIAYKTNQILPKTTSIIRDPLKRIGRVYVDFLQNGQSKTVVAPYSLRPVEGAPVATPLLWSEVKPGLDPSAFNIATINKRLKQKKDPFMEMLFKKNKLDVSKIKFL